jgi:hypothetical protein
MSYSGVELTIKATTLSTVGVDVSPHLFRTPGASSAATHGGDNPHLASALLHHTHPGVTNAHYNRAPSLSAADTLRKIMRQYEKTVRDVRNRGIGHAGRQILRAERLYVVPARQPR